VNNKIKHKIYYFKNKSNLKENRQKYISRIFDPFRPAIIYKKILSRPDPTRGSIRPMDSSETTKVPFSAA